MKANRNYKAVLPLLILCLSLTLCVGVSFAMPDLLIKSSSQNNSIEVDNPSSDGIEITSALDLFNYAYDEKYNDEAFVSNSDSRKVLVLLQDIVLSDDLCINRDVNINLNGHTLNLNNHTLMFRHNYFGKFIIYSSEENATITNGTLKVLTPNASVSISEGLLDTSTTYNPTIDVMEVAADYVKYAFLNGPAYNYYLSEDDLPYIHRYGNHNIDFNYDDIVSDHKFSLTYQETTNEYTIDGLNIYSSSTNRNDFIVEASINYFERNIEKYYNIESNKYSINHSIKLPLKNEYLDTMFSYSSDETDVTITNDTQTVIVNPLPNIEFDLNVDILSLTTNSKLNSTDNTYPFVSRNDTYRGDNAVNIIRAMLSQSIEKDSEITYKFYSSIALTASIIDSTKNVNDVHSYKYEYDAADENLRFAENKFTLSTNPLDIKLDSLGEEFEGTTAVYLGLESISYTFVADNYNVFKYDETTNTVGMNTITEQEVFNLLEKINAAIKVTMIIDSIEVNTNIPVRFSWDSSETITGATGGGVPSSRFGTYLQTLRQEIKNETNDLYTINNFTMRSSFDNKAPFVLYDIEYIGRQANDPKILTMNLVVESGTYAGTYNVVKETQNTNYAFTLVDVTNPSRIYTGNDLYTLLAADTCHMAFNIDTSRIPMNGAMYKIKYYYCYGLTDGSWHKTEQEDILRIKGVVKNNKYYDANGEFYVANANGTITEYNNTQGTQYFNSESLFNYIRGLCSGASSEFLYTDDLSKSINVILSTQAHPEITYDNYNWLSLLTNIKVLDLRGRKFGNAGTTNLLPILADHQTLEELYIGGYAGNDNINTNLTALDTLPSLINLKVLDISYSQVRLFTPVTKSAYPLLEKFYCEGIVIENTILFGLITYVDDRYGSTGSQNVSTLNNLRESGVFVNSGGGLASDIQKKLEQIITQENLLVKGNYIPLLYYEGPVDENDPNNTETVIKLLITYDELIKYKDSLLYNVGTSDAPIFAEFATTESLNNLIDEVEDVYIQFPNDNSIFDDNAGFTGGTAGKYYGFAQQYKEEQREGVFNRPVIIPHNYYPLIRIKCASFVYNDSYLESVSFEVSYYDIVCPTNEDVKLDESSKEKITKFLNVSYFTGTESNYQNFDDVYFIVLEQYLDDARIDNAQNIDMDTLNADSTNILAVYNKFLSIADENNEVVSRLFTALNRPGKCDCVVHNENNKLLSITTHFNNLITEYIEQCASKFYSTYIEGTNNFNSIINNRNRVNPASYITLLDTESTQTDGYWHNASLSENGCEQTSNFINFEETLSSYKNLNSYVKKELEKYKLSGYAKPSSEAYYSSSFLRPRYNSPSQSTTRYTNKSIYWWLNFIVNEINADVINVRNGALGQNESTTIKVNIKSSLEPQLPNAYNNITDDIYVDWINKITYDVDDKITSDSTLDSIGVSDTHKPSLLLDSLTEADKVILGSEVITVLEALAAKES